MGLSTLIEMVIITSKQAGRNAFVTLASSSWSSWVENIITGPSSLSIFPPLHYPSCENLPLKTFKIWKRKGINKTCVKLGNSLSPFMVGSELEVPLVMTSNDSSWSTFSLHKRLKCEDAQSLNYRKQRDIVLLQRSRWTNEEVRCWRKLPRDL